MNEKARQMAFHDFSFSLSKDCFTSLVCDTYKYKDLFSRNLKTVFNKAK